MVIGSREAGKLKYSSGPGFLISLHNLSNTLIFSCPIIENVARLLIDFTIHMAVY